MSQGGSGILMLRNRLHRSKRSVTDVDNGELSNPSDSSTKRWETTFNVSIDWHTFIWIRKVLRPFFDVPISPDQAEINFKPHKTEHSFLSVLIVNSNNKTKVHIDEAGASGASLVLTPHKKMWKVWKPDTSLANLSRLENEDWKFCQEPGDTGFKMIWMHYWE